MLNLKLVEKQLSYSGYDLDWLKEQLKTQEDRENWETVGSFVPNDSIVYSICFGKYFGNSACLVAANEAIFMIFADYRTNEIISEKVEYSQLRNITIERSKTGKLILLADISDETRIGFEVSNQLAATHMRYTIIHEIDSRSTVLGNRQFGFNNKLEQQVVNRREEILEIENELDLEPLLSEPDHRSFEENFKKIKTVYHIRRIIVSMLVLWFPVFAFITYLIAWRIELFITNESGDPHIFILSPTIADIFTIILSSGILGCVVFLFIYQKHLKNIIINLLCYSLFVCLSIIIATSCVTMISTVVLAEKVVDQNEMTNVHDLAKIIKQIGLFTSLLSFVTGLVVFVPLIMLNIGIYQNNKVK